MNHKQNLNLMQKIQQKLQQKLEDVPNEDNNFKKIPLKIFQTWHTKFLPKHMIDATSSLKNNNKEFEYYLYDDQDCVQFIARNFDKEVVHTYCSLIPGAYKADLWRLCILYMYGGIYLDIKFRHVNDFKLINLTDKEHYAIDRSIAIDRNDPQKNIVPIYNGLMISYPKNKKLLDGINKIVENTQNKYYGYNPLYPTGPAMLGHVFDKYEIDKSLVHKGDSEITFNNETILEEYPEYRVEQSKNQLKPYYSILWKKRSIYR